MITTAQFSVTDSTAVKVFEGAGKVRVRAANKILLGASGLSQSTGFRPLDGSVVEFEFSNTSEIWALVPTGESSNTVYVMVGG